MNQDRYSSDINGDTGPRSIQELSVNAPTQAVAQILARWPSPNTSSARSLLAFSRYIINIILNGFLQISVEFKTQVVNLQNAPQKLTRMR